MREIMDRADKQEDLELGLSATEASLNPENDYIIDKSLEERLAEDKMKNAYALKMLGIPISTIQEVLELSNEEISDVQDYSIT